MSDHDRPTVVVGDVHGHRDELVHALRDAGLLDPDGNWAGGQTEAWFLGDFVDRGPDGLGVIDLVMGLVDQAAEAGGSVQTLLGNHEILMLGMHRFADTEVPSDFGYRSFERSWRLNGGRPQDIDGLTETHIDWLLSCPVVTHAADHLLLHSDTTAYLEWGDDADEINKAVHDVLTSDDIVEWWEVWRRMTTRYAFRGPDGPEVADLVLAQLGGSRIVHGHSVIADQLGVMPSEVSEPLLYADDKVLAVDGGVFVGGPMLVVPLPWRPEGD